ncbi:aminotransferase class I/II-fold pyridoxal phosphate-dependent enzyme [Nonomuraea sp. NPDC049625]|uniref:pyridoxal phosphate-dependent aminotransferase n=1 Tax=Nonomuraea sp. NPDC049625 TaxID=3155775 RepID=UPI003418B3A0
MIKPRRAVAETVRTAMPDASRRQYLKLDRNELVPPVANSVFQAVIDQLEPDSFSAYPAVQPLYEDLAAALGVAPNQLLLGAGSDWLVRACFDTFVEEGDEVVIPVPTYGMYPVYAGLRGGELTPLEHLDGFGVPVAGIRKSLQRNPKLLALANPNGALGCYLPWNELHELVVEAAKHDTLVVVDEAYVEYTGDESTARLAAHNNLILIRTFSKACGLAGLRLGYAVGPVELMDWMRRTRPNVEVNEVAVVAGRYLLRHPEVVRHQVALGQAGKQLLVRELTALGCEVYPGAANFVQVQFGWAREGILKLLRSADILVKDQAGAGILDGWTRITVGSPEQMQRVVAIAKQGMGIDERSPDGRA